MEWGLWGWNILAIDAMFVAISTFFWAVGGIVGAESGDLSSPVLTQEEMRFIQLANAERESRDLAALTVDPMLVAIARKHSWEMAELGYFDHVSPTQGHKTPMDRYLAEYKRRPYWLYVGENLYYCTVVDPDRGHRKLMESASHRGNILDPRFTSMGVGVYIDKRGRFWVTQMFAARKDEPDDPDAAASG
jgi:uncharacterized protein YkwD